jgi:hypothetical protein
MATPGLCSRRRASKGNRQFRLVECWADLSVLGVIVAGDRPSDDRPSVPLWVKVGLALVGTLGVGRLTVASGGGVSSLFALAFFGGWVVVPYALTTALWRRTPASEGHRLALTLGTGAICALGLLAYVPAQSASSTSALVFLFAPLWQLMCVGALWVVSNVWRRAASTQRESR